MPRSVIAEIGINHDGDALKARLLIEAASKSGCQGIKFQYRNLRNSYFAKGTEIGDEIIQSEIERAYLSPEQILDLTAYARDFGLKAGISFFTVEDINDYSNAFESFDFFKIPSAELMNVELINSLLSSEKMVYISVGMHSENQIDSIFSPIQGRKNWVPMQCVSNYPVSIHNTSLGYISHLKKKWNREIGYSSHDQYWESCLLAAQLGATVIERHITFEKEGNGLDHSSSSTPDEFERLNVLMQNLDLIMLGDADRVPNQGELLNRQNLGRSFYAIKDLPAGSPINFQDFVYRSPLTGLSVDELENVQNKIIYSPVSKGEVLSRDHFRKEPFINTSNEIEVAKANNISLPVRLMDYEDIRRLIPVGAYEFHLSFKEVESGLEKFDIHADDTFSIHLPDYLDSNTLINPWSENPSVRSASLRCVRKIKEFAEKLANETGKKIPIVASLAGIGEEKNKYYSNASEFLSSQESPESTLTLQWLPPFAWYFGGSIALSNINNTDDIDYLLKYAIPLTLDTSHLLLGANAFGFDPFEVLNNIRPLIAHTHISDALGLDGEGIQLGEGGSRSHQLLSTTIGMESLKVIEVWQGHLDNYYGFKEAVRRIANMMEKSI